MSYLLVNGKRGYRDDITGEVIIDNVSQSVADRRAQQWSPPPPPRSSVSRRPHPSRRSRPVYQLISLLRRITRSAAIAVTIGSLLLIGAYFLKEPVQFQSSIHYALRDTSAAVGRTAQVAARLTALLETERGNTND